MQGLTDSMKAESEQLQTSINEEKEKLFGVKDLAQDKADLEAKIEELNAALREEDLRGVGLPPVAKRRPIIDPAPLRSVRRLALPLAALAWPWAWQPWEGSARTA